MNKYYFPSPPPSRYAGRTYTTRNDGAETSAEPAPKNRDANSTAASRGNNETLYYDDIH